MGGWVSLDERGEDLCMLSEIGKECITAPSSHYLHSFYGHARKQVEKRSTNAYAVPLQRFQAGLLGSYRQTLDESRLGEGTKSAFVLIREEMSIWRWAVYLPMILQGAVGVRGSRMRAPVHVFALERGCLGAWEVENSNLEAVGVPVNAYVGDCDMEGGGKRVKPGNDEFPDPRGRIKAGSQAGEDGRIEGVVQYQLQTDPGYEVRGVWLPLLPPGGGWGETLGCPENCL